jgi:type III secretion protein R
MTELSGNILATFLEQKAAVSPPMLTLYFTGLALLPLLVMACTCMLKLSIVFTIFRSALGAGQIPSAPISTLLSVVLTVHIMSPVAADITSLAQATLSSKPDGPLLSICSEVFAPLVRFMEMHTGEKERQFFRQVGDKEFADISVIIPAFVFSQLREGLMIGIVIYIPFLVVDLVVANLLVGLGMMMVSPMQISLPLKLLLFSLCDGWILLGESLILSYSISL